MRSVLLAAVMLCTASLSVAGVDLTVGAYGGMNIPVANDDAELGPLFGVQAKLSFFNFMAIGAHYQGSQWGSPTQVFFEGQPNEFEGEKDGGSIQSFAGDLYLGRVGGTGFNFFLVGSIGTFQWTRDNQDDITKTLYAAGLGFEINLPIHLGVELRTMFEAVPFDDNAIDGTGSYKNINWFIGGNYHFGTPSY